MIGLAALVVGISAAAVPVYIIWRARLCSEARKEIISRPSLPYEARVSFLRQCLVTSPCHHQPSVEYAIEVAIGVWNQIADELELEPGNLRPEDCICSLECSLLPWSHPLVDATESIILSVENTYGVGNHKAIDSLESLKDVCVYCAMCVCANSITD